MPASKIMSVHFESVALRLFLIEQKTNTGYDTYDSAVVAAKDEEEAKGIDPGGCYVWVSGIGWADNDTLKPRDYDPCTWVDPHEVTATLIGTAKEGTERGVICASFNAG